MISAEVTRVFAASLAYNLWCYIDPHVLLLVLFTLVKVLGYPVMEGAYSHVVSIGSAVYSAIQVSIIYWNTIME